MFTTAPLFGKFHSPLKHAAQPLSDRSLHHLESLCDQRIDPAFLAPNPSHANSRQRRYFPKLTFLAFLDQVLNPGASCRRAVRQIRAGYQKQPDPEHLDKDTSAYCQARARWSLDKLLLDDIKTTLHLVMLSCLTPAMIHKELEMHLIAYNLIRSIMSEAASVCHAPLDRLSFKGTLDTACQYSQTIAQIPASRPKLRRQVYADMLAIIAEDQVPERPDRFEPRCQKRRPKRYPFMTRPRRELRAAHADHLRARKKARS